PVLFTTHTGFGRFRPAPKAHHNAFRPWLAHAAMQGVLHRQPVEVAVAWIDLEHKRMRLGALATHRPAAEAARAVRRRRADPALHQLVPPIEWPWGRREAATPAICP